MPCQCQCQCLPACMHGLHTDGEDDSYIGQSHPPTLHEQPACLNAYTRTNDERGGTAAALQHTAGCCGLPRPAAWVGCLGCRFADDRYHSDVARVANASFRTKAGINDDYQCWTQVCVCVEGGGAVATVTAMRVPSCSCSCLKHDGKALAARLGPGTHGEARTMCMACTAPCTASTSPSTTPDVHSLAPRRLLQRTYVAY